MPFNTELTRALGIRGELLQHHVSFHAADHVEQCPSSRAACNGSDTQNSPAQLAMPVAWE